VIELPLKPRQHGALQILYCIILYYWRLTGTFSLNWNLILTKTVFQLNFHLITILQEPFTRRSVGRLHAVVMSGRSTAAAPSSRRCRYEASPRSRSKTGWQSSARAEATSGGECSHHAPPLQTRAKLPGGRERRPSLSLAVTVYSHKFRGAAALVPLGSHLSAALRTVFTARATVTPWNAVTWTRRKVRELKRKTRKSAKHRWSWYRC